MGSPHCPPTLNRSNQDQERESKKMALTVLEKLESIGNAGLITIEEKSSSKFRLSGIYLLFCQLRSKLNSTSHNSTGLDRNRTDPGRRNLKVVSWVGFPDVRSKWTTQRGGSLTRKCEVIVPVQQANMSASPGCLQNDVYILCWVCS